MSDGLKCYDCVHRRPIPGDCHSQCQHPDAMTNLLAMQRRVDVPKPFTDLHIRGSAHGIKHGWFLWPFNFDPVWLENCNGFIAKEEKSEADSATT